MGLYLDRELRQGLCVALSLWLVPIPALSNQLTRYEVFDEWLVECRSQEDSDQENCLVRSGPHIARTGQEVSGFTLSVNPKANAIGVESKAALGLEARVDQGELFSTPCEAPFCTFSNRESARLISQMKSGSVLLARIVTPEGEVVGQFTLRDFREALAIAKQPVGVFRKERLTSLDIRALQTLLIDQGYSPGPKDGKLGPRTRTAIIAYQRDHSLIDDGKPSRALLFRLRAED